MKNEKLIVVSGNEISDLLRGREEQITEIISEAYQCHGKGLDYLPQSVFIRFPNDEKNRIIGLPAYLGGNFEKSGMKWIASYPKNHNKGLDRASATIILNSFETGIPIAVLEGSVISAKRTAASAALAAKHLVQKSVPTNSISLIGCGLINFETLRFVKAQLPEITKVYIFDTSSENAEKFVNKCKETFNDLDYIVLDNVEELLKSSTLISLATTSVTPHIKDISHCQEGTTILHISLRDFSSEVILSNANVVDDVEHVCRANTSIHLSEQESGNRDFIRASLPEILLGEKEGRQDDEEIVIFSPFGLGILDIALSSMIYDISEDNGKGQLINSFLPDYWLNRN